jgi:hypothetical protein
MTRRRPGTPSSTCCSTRQAGRSTWREIGNGRSPACRMRPVERVDQGERRRRDNLGESAAPGPARGEGVARLEIRPRRRRAQAPRSRVAG